MYPRILLILILFTIAAAVGALTPRLSAQCAVPSYKFLPNTANPNIVPSRPVVADFNRDGNLDAAFTNFVAGTTTIAIGNGAGGFTSSNIATGAEAPFTVVGDFRSELAAILPSRSILTAMGKLARRYSGRQTRHGSSHNPPVETGSNNSA